MKIKRINRSMTCFRIVGGGVALAFFWAIFAQHEALPVHAAQAAPPVDTHAQPGLPPNLDWSNFLPAGDGQFQTTVFCGSCHNMKVVVDRRADTEGWNQIVRRMINTHAATIQGDDATAIGNYLGKALSKTTPALNLPIHVNTVSEESLNFLGTLPPEAVQKILDARAKAKIKDFAALAVVVGDKNIDKYKGVLVFD